MIAPKKTSYLVFYDVECSMMGHELYDVVSESAVTGRPGSHIHLGSESSNGF